MERAARWTTRCIRRHRQRVTLQTLIWLARELTLAEDMPKLGQWCQRLTQSPMSNDLESSEWFKRHGVAVSLPEPTAEWNSSRNPSPLIVVSSSTTSKGLPRTLGCSHGSAC